VEEERRDSAAEPGPSQAEGAAAGSGPGGAGDQPSEEELRRRIEEGLRKVRMQDVLLESVVTIVNLTARRIGKEDERDLEQARIGIEAVRSMVELLEPEPQTQVRNALSELQMLYARNAKGEDETGGAEPGSEPAAGPPEGGGSGPQEPRRGEPPPGLWVPPGTS
jgi:hypothetical protein